MIDAINFVFYWSGALMWTAGGALMVCLLFLGIMDMVIKQFGLLDMFYDAVIIVLKQRKAKKGELPA